MSEASDSASLRPMTPRDRERVLEIIAGSDPGEVDDARADLKQRTQGMFVYEDAGRVVGVTGYEPAPETDRTYWLSWTALDPLYLSRPAVGVAMLHELLEKLVEQNARMVFADLGEQGSAGALRRVYEQAGFVEELRHERFYSPGEAMSVLSVRLQIGYEPEDAADADERGIEIDDWDEIEETDDAYGLEWRYAEDGGASRSDLEEAVEEIAGEDGRLVLLAIPSVAAQGRRLAESCGFRLAGGLKDYYEDGIDEWHFRRDLT